MAGATGGWIGLEGTGKTGADSSGPGTKASSIGVIVEEGEDKGNSALGRTGGEAGLAKTV